MIKVTHKYTGKERFWSKVIIKGLDDCWEWTGNTTKGNGKGYGRFRIDNKMLLAHRLSWIFTHGYIPEGKLILHKCDNPLCINPNHLYLGTNSNNMKDKFKRNRQPLLPPEISAINHAKLYEGEIWLIRKLWKDRVTGITQRFISKMFKVDQSTVSLIVNSSKWLCKEGYYI